MPYEYLENVALSDVAFRASGKTLEEMLVSAWEATLALMVENPQNLHAQEFRSFQVKDTAADFLLCKFLGELIYFKDAETLLLRISSLQVQKVQDDLIVSGEAFGERIDPMRHSLGVDVKAVTLYQLRVENTPDGWNCQVVLDV